MHVRAGDELGSLLKIPVHLRNGPQRFSPGYVGASLSLRSQTWNAVYRALDSIRGYSGAGYLLDLAGGARSVVDKNALPQPQIDDVLLARYLIRHDGCR